LNTHCNFYVYFAASWDEIQDGIYPAPERHEMSNAKKGLLETVELYHNRIPGLRQLPFAVTSIISAIVAVNILVWVGVGVILVSARSFKRSAMRIK